MYSGKVVVFGKGCCIREKGVVFGQKWFYSGKSSCNRANWLYSVRNCCFLEKAVVFRQGDCSGKKWLY